MGSGVDTVLDFSICWGQVEERYIIIDWARGNGEGAGAFECPFPDNLAYAVNYLQLAAVVRDLFCYLS